MLSVLVGVVYLQIKSNQLRQQVITLDFLENLLDSSLSLTMRFSFSNDSNACSVSCSLSIQDKSLQFINNYI